jgi:predicted phage terminase large subunit-like protein
MLGERSVFARLADELEYDWRSIARVEQLPPAGDHWSVWLFMAGRGSGKTRAGAEAVRAWIEAGAAKRVGLIAPTTADTRDVQLEGPSGLLSIWPASSRPLYEPSKRRVSFQNGAVATTFSSEEPERLRGPQHDLLWFDELAAFKNARAVWDNAMLGLRLGKRPRAIVTTTPRPVPLIRDLLKRSGKDVSLTRAKTSDNAENLAPAFLSEIAGRYAQTRLGRQELDGEMLEDSEGALWSRDLIEVCRCEQADLPPMKRLVIAIDPAVSAGAGSDETGIIVAGLGTDGHGYVVEDASGKYLPIAWAQRAVSLYRQHAADRVVAESNNGGQLVEQTIRTVDANVSLKLVHASRGKIARAEPISALFEQKRAHLVGSLPELEDQMCTFTPGSSGSPDRLDAMVWALTELMLSLSSADIWIDWYRREAQRAQIALPAAEPSALKDDPLPWRSGPSAATASPGNALTRRYWEIRSEFSRLFDGSSSVCSRCGGALEPGGRTISDGFETWHLPGDCARRAN